MALSNTTLEMVDGEGRNMYVRNTFQLVGSEKSVVSSCVLSSCMVFRSWAREGEKFIFFLISA
jgi:hypothetical protein